MSQFDIRNFVHLLELDGGTQFADIYLSSNSFHIYNPISDGDIILQGNDGGSAITALPLAMSDAG